MIRVHGGDLRLHGCWLSGALGNAPPWYQGLIAFAGSGNPETDRAAECAVVDSVLASGNSCFHTLGTGGRIRLQNSLVFSGGEAFHLDPGPPADSWRPLSALLPWFTANMGGELLLTGSLPVWWTACQRDLKYPPRSRFNTQVLLDRNTFALRGSLVRLGQAADVTAPLTDAYILQGQANVFVDPFPGLPRRSGLLLFEADALTKGLLVWRGDGNGYDAGLRYFVSSADRPADPSSSRNVWTRLWGTPGERRPQFIEVQPADRRLSLDEPRPDLLAPILTRAKLKGPPPGADSGKLPAAPKK
jgi:hypothetical protein